MKKILFVASEAVPFIKTGGLADVVGTLPKYFNKKKYDVRVVLPKYTCMSTKYEEKLQHKLHFDMKLSWRSQYVGVDELKLDGVTFYFIDNEYYFGGNQPYGEMHMDLEKFAFFSKAAISILPGIDFKPDIIHCHDWQAGLVPIFLDYFQFTDDFYKNINTIITVHNLKFQGVWNARTIQDITGLPDFYFTSDKMSMRGDANFLKSGLVYADKVTTVSTSYAEEIKTAFYGEGLEWVLQSRENVLSGIVNGIDYEEYNPQTDTYIDVNYDVTSFRKNKVKNKKLLQKELGMEENSKVMMLGIVSRLTSQKGLDLINYVMDELCKEDIQLVVLGTGDENYENSFKYFANKYNNKVSANIYYSEEMSHKIYASCDAFLMPSLFEPCGLSQLMSMRYGTIPIVRETGGLIDTVEPYNEYEKIGTGFSFANFNGEEMLNTIRYAIKIYYKNKRDWNKIVDRAMEKDFSWNRSALEYEKIYDNFEG